MKAKYPLSQALDVACELVDRLGIKPNIRCDRLVFAGSLRRRAPAVGDIEVVYVPRWIEAPDPGDLFGAMVRRNDTDAALEEMLADGTLARRKNVDGAETWGEFNKFGVHTASSIPIDFFATAQDPGYDSVSGHGIHGGIRTTGCTGNPHGASSTLLRHGPGS